MFKVEDFVIYGNNGVCKVKEIGPVDISGIPKTRLYYTLVPVYSKGSEIHTPVDNNKVTLRAVIEREEAKELIADMGNIEILWFAEDKKRENVFRDVIRTCDCREWIKVIKTTYLNKQSRIAEGKRVTASDEKYLHIAEDYLYGELAVALNVKKDQVGEFIIKKIDELEIEETVKL